MGFEIPRLHIVRETQAEIHTPSLKQERVYELERAGGRIDILMTAMQPDEIVSKVPEPEETALTEITPIQPELSEEALMQMADLEAAYQKLRAA